MVGLTISCYHLSEADLYRTQPWSTYSVLQTTITAWALPYDGAMLFSAYRMSEFLSAVQTRALFTALFLWIFVFSKTVKLWGHYARYPEDVRFIPLYIAFGYGHGFIKLWGALTLGEVSYLVAKKLVLPLLTSLERPLGEAEMVPTQTTVSV